MQGLNPSLKHLGRTRIFTNLKRADAVFSQKLKRAARA